MAIPHYAYLVLKMPGLRGIVCIVGDVKWAFDCDRESCEMADRLTSFVELQDWKLEGGLGQVPHGPGHALGHDPQDVHPVGGLTQQNYPVVDRGGFQGCSHRQIRTRAHQISLEK
jgi:hypothetical protein